MISRSDTFKALGSFLVGLSFLLGPSAIASKKPFRFVNSPEDLLHHFRLHIRRVQRLGMALYDSHPELFGSLPREVVAEYLSEHDAEKINRTHEFKRTFWVDPIGTPDFVVRLLPNYGRGMPRAERIADFKADHPEINSLNEVGRRVREAFLKRHPNLSLEDIAKLKRIDRIADVVDRNTDRVAREELGISWQLPLSDFLKDPDDLRLGRDLKNNYKKIIPRRIRYEYHVWRSCALLGWWLRSK